MQVSLAIYYALRVLRAVEVASDKSQRTGARNFSLLFICFMSFPVLSLVVPTIAITINSNNIKWAVWSWLLGPLFFILSFLSFVVFFIDWIKSKKLSPADYSVPISINAVIHRMGEFVTLMLGESVLSLVLVVEGYKTDIYSALNLATFCILMLTATLLHFQHFSSYPDHAEDHIARKSKNKGTSHAELPR